MGSGDVHGLPNMQPSLRPGNKLAVRGLGQDFSLERDCGLTNFHSKLGEMAGLPVRKGAQEELSSPAGSAKTAHGPGSVCGAGVT